VRADTSGREASHEEIRDKFARQARCPAELVGAAARFCLRRDPARPGRIAIVLSRVDAERRGSDARTGQCEQEEILGAKTLRIVPTTFSVAARDAKLSEEQRRLVANAVDRSRRQTIWRRAASNFPRGLVTQEIRLVPLPCA